LLSILVQVIEYAEENILRFLFSREELHVINN
jgi:hypothetical protein